MSNWFEADNGFLINLSLVKAVQRSTDYSCTVFFHIGDIVESVTCSMPYESVKSILEGRANAAAESQQSIKRSLRTISSGSFTPVP